MRIPYISKIFLYCCGLFIVLFAFFAFVSINNTTTLLNEIVVNVNVQFGRGPSCIGRGICSVDEPGTDGGGNHIDPLVLSNNASGQFYTNSKGAVTLDIFKNSIAVSTKEEQFINGFFEQGEDLILPNYLTSSAQVPGGFTIKNGQYPVIDNTDRYTIYF